MRHITTLVWELADRPPVTGGIADKLTAHPGRCAVCAQHAEVTAPVDAALGANFTDRSMFRRPDADRACTACVWCCSGKGTTTLRLWTVVAAPGEQLPASQPKAFLQQPGLCLTNRADPTPVADILLNPPAGEWAVTIAVSGQKHVVPYGRVNRGGGREWTVRMENTDITTGPDTWRLVLGHTAALRHAGHSAEHVRDAAPDLRATKTPQALEAWRRHAAVLAPYVRSPLIDLALWCCTKTTTPLYAHLEPSCPNPI